MCCGSDFGGWWKNEATDIEKINWLIMEQIVAFKDKEDPLVGIELFPAIEISRRKKYIRVTTEDGEAYFKNEYFEPVANLCKPKQWFLTQKRRSDRNKNIYRLLVGMIDEDKRVLLAPIQPDPIVREAFEEAD